MSSLHTAGVTGRADALYVALDPLVNTNRVRINTLALGARLPTAEPFREFVEAAGLMSYGPNLPDLYRRAGDFVDKILKGTKPGDIPIEQPTKFNLVINLTTAKAPLPDPRLRLRHGTFPFTKSRSTSLRQLISTPIIGVRIYIDWLNNWRSRNPIAFGSHALRIYRVISRLQ